MPFSKWVFRLFQHAMELYSKYNVLHFFRITKIIFFHKLYNNDNENNKNNNGDLVDGYPFYRYSTKLIYEIFSTKLLIRNKITFT